MDRSHRQTCPSAGRTTTTLLLSFLALAAHVIPGATASKERRRDFQTPDLLMPPLPLPNGEEHHGNHIQGREHEFKLRHVFHHGTHRYPKLHRRMDIQPDTELYWADEDGLHAKADTTFRARSRATNIERLVDRSDKTIDSYLDYGRMTGSSVSLPSSAWTVDEVSGPNVTDKESVITFAKMAANAYVLEPSNGEWQDIKGNFNYTSDFGWQLDGLRGHIFADEKNTTLVIALKGTSTSVFGGSDTVENDRTNDNLFFSCCCGQGGRYWWKQVCDCQTSTYTCNSTCVVKALREKNRYYYAAQELYRNVTEIYPDSDVWITGHSLGGAVSSLLGLTYGLPVITYEAVPQALPAMRLGLPIPPGYHAGSHQSRRDTGAYHFGHTADPVYMGTCNTVDSICSIWGYAMESQCHTGYKCVYDTVGDHGWRLGMGYHGIKGVIHNVLEKYDKPAECKPAPSDCVDCYNWKFFESNHSEPITSTRSSTTSDTRTRTRTQTCKTPGWWGCLDESTTTASTTVTTKITTTTCLTPGWFGCKDAVSTTITTTTAVPTAAPAPSVTTTSSPATTSPTASPTKSATTTCEHPGWFGGCNDPSITTGHHTATKTSRTPSPTSSTTCTSKEWFGFICVDPSPDGASRTPRPTRTSVSPPKETLMCAHRNWYGRCKEWKSVEASLRDEV